MRALLEANEELNTFQEVLEQLKRGPGVHLITGCIDSQKTHLSYCLGRDYSCRVFICRDENRAVEVREEMKLLDSSVFLYPARDVLFFEADIRGNALTCQRVEAIKGILEEKSLTVVTTIDAFQEYVAPPAFFSESGILIHYDDSLNISELAVKLVNLGYARASQVEAPGQFAIRGGIVDIFALAEENPWRIELWGEDVDSIRAFDVESQRSIENLKEILIYPAADPGDHPGEKHTFLEYFDREHTLLILDEPNHLVSKGEFVEDEYRESMANRLEKGYVSGEEADLLSPLEQVFASMGSFRSVALCTLDSRRDIWSFVSLHHMETRGIGSYNNSFELLVKDLTKYGREKYRTILMAGSRTRGRRLAEDLVDRRLAAFYTEDPEHDLKKGQILVTFGRLNQGYEYPLSKFLVIAEGDIFGHHHKTKHKRIARQGDHIRSFQELKPGDFVVHENHGLGIYRGIEKIEIDHIIKDYMKIEYAKGGNLYLPATGLDMIQKYSGGEGKTPKLNRLGSGDWARTKTKVKSAVAVIAQELVDLYAVRQNGEGYEYGPDTVWQREFEELFEFEETEDQLQAIEATKKDMESRKIMDRLICGDVGFGKTEIAIRAAFKAVQESKQVAFLVPTTILAQQHYNTFAQRMKDFPVRVDLMCRFRTGAQQKKTVQDLKNGQVDIVIGTHRILSQDVNFKDLGLLVIDEEQRFGVAHKEKIKQMKKNVDVLTLTATPIPRTLHMSLTGIRDMSLLEEAPTDRNAIQTYVMEYNEETVREAIGRELAREGQVYYVYNRVDTISEITAFIQKLVPDAVVAYAHGQMPERKLEGIMYDFINGDIDVLVSTTIIETGLDISNVNTMIIHDADAMGLSQLYQLRGRVGRSNRRAYAFLMYRRNKMLKEVAEKRLRAIREFTELGSGFRIALKDLEIRGAGNVLGESQHGHMQAVGYDMYCKMLGEAVKRAKGEEEEIIFDTEIDLSIDAYIPGSYILNEVQKLDIYQRIAGVNSREEQADMLEELTDRFGDPPLAVQNLLEVAGLKAKARVLGVAEITQKGEAFKFVFHEQAPLDPGGIPDLLGRNKGKMGFRAEEKPYLTYERKGNASGKKQETPLEVVSYVLGEIGTLKVGG